MSTVLWVSQTRQTHGEQMEAGVSQGCHKGSWERTLGAPSIHKPWAQAEYSQPGNMDKESPGTLNHWGIGDVLLFNLVENVELRLRPRKKRIYTCLLPPESIQHFVWLEQLWWMSQPCDLNRGHCFDEMHFLVALTVWEQPDEWRQVSFCFLFLL